MENRIQKALIEIEAAKQKALVEIEAAKQAALVEIEAAKQVALLKIEATVEEEPIEEIPEIKIKDEEEIEVEEELTPERKAELEELYQSIKAAEQKDIDERTKTKICSCCGEELVYMEFGNRKSEPDGKAKRCKWCDKNWKELKDKTPEEVRKIKIRYGRF